MDWEVVDDGSFNGLRKLMRTNDADEGTVEIKYEDIGSTRAAVEANKADESFDKRKDMWRIGHVPASVGMKWLIEEGIDMWNPAHQDAVLKKLACSDYRHLVPGLNRIIF